ncbi:Zn-ribbon domain-containing OB-fold protein [Novosphingobium sp. G106]|uniref:Zn-ribbon domain-containing OB-fold protein n=1 Tax=Novosphingobium sp. G106 TaxID=2849500 RepID=UPI0020C57633|nr:zinc ribbon domain-containing protein [Novosphingobium sp. G106]
MSSPPRPVPKLDAENRAFWTGGAEGKLNITQCGDCGKFTHPPRILCRHCQSENVAPAAVAGTGVIDTMTVNHQAWAPGLEVPFIIARVALDGVPGGLPDDQYRRLADRGRELWRQGPRHV